MLYIVCKDSSNFKDTIKVILEDKLGMFDYEIVDPKYHQIDRSFSNVLILNDIGKITINAHKTWTCKAPDSSMSVDEKKAIFAKFKEIAQYVRDNTLNKTILQNDVPRFADLTEFLHSFKGQVMELKLADGRFIGIYPDGDKFQSKYPAEYHVSTILNLAKLQDILGYTKLSVKDL